MPDSSSRVQIVSGKNVETETAKAICDFAIDKLGVTRTKMRVLYATLIELMSNTAKHAYQDNNTRMIAQWYLHALYDDDKISVSFMDTGEGIPNTLKKKIIERVFQLPDSQLIELSLTERGRSETGLPNRGRGLPNLFQHVKKNEINDFYVLSGSGSCIYSQEDGKLILQEYEHNIYGTIFNFMRKNYIPRDSKFGIRAFARNTGLSSSHITRIIHGEKCKLEHFDSSAIKDGWCVCPKCGTRLFEVPDFSYIEHWKYKCDNPECGYEFEINTPVLDRYIVNQNT